MPIDRDTLRQLAHIVRPLTTRVANVIAKGVVTLVNDSKMLQLVQLAGPLGSTIDGGAGGGGEHVQPYGFSSVPLAGADTAVVVFPNGDSTHPLVLAVADRRYRPTGGQAGEVTMYTDEGDTIRLGRGHVMTLATSGTIKLGGSSANEGAIKGNARDTAEQTFLTALDTFVGLIVPTTGAPAAAITAFKLAITAFKSAVTSAISTKVKLE